MEILDENFFTNLKTKIKNVFGSGETQTPEQDLLEEMVSYIKVALFETVGYLSQNHPKNKGDSTVRVSDKPYNKMDIASDLIRNILQLIKTYKIKIKSNEDTPFTKNIYTNVVQQLHNIQKETSVVDFEKTLISIAKFILKLADRETKEEHGHMGDDMIEAHNSLKNLFKSFPTSNYRELKNVLDKKGKIPGINIRKEYIDRIRKEYQQTYKNSSKATVLPQTPTDPTDEWSQENKPTEEDLFQDYLEKRITEDFEKLWDESFKDQWIADYKKEVEAERAAVSHLKECVSKHIRKIFIKG